MCQGHNAGEFTEIIIKDRIKVDSCIANEVGWLNEHGVITRGSCCGHGQYPGSILIKRSCSKRARELGYDPKPYYLSQNRLWSRIRTRIASWIYGENLNETWLAEIQPKYDMYHISAKAYDRATGEICKRCFREHACGFQIPDNMWNTVVEERYNVLCLTCFDELATEKGIKWDHVVTHLAPVSRLSWK